MLKLKSLVSFSKMGCVNSRDQIKHPKKPLPSIPPHQPSINNGGGTNNSSASLSSSSALPQSQPPPPLPLPLTTNIDSQQYPQHQQLQQLRNNSINDNYASNGYAGPPPPLLHQQQSMPSNSSFNGEQHHHQQQQQYQQQQNGADQNTTMKSNKKKGFLPWSKLKGDKVNRQVSVVSNTSDSTHSASSPAVQSHMGSQSGGSGGGTLSSGRSNAPLPIPPVNRGNCGPGNSGPQQKVVIALYPYEGRDDGELSFEKNEKLVVVDDSEPDWWLAYRLMAPERRGYIPMNFVVNNVIETEEWFFSKISRRVAERLLLEGNYPRGTFLIRNSEQDTGGHVLSAYSLSIRDFDNIKFDHVKHYKIQTKPNGDFFVTSRRTFVKLQDLVEHYSASANGLCHRLTKPCPKVRIGESPFRNRGDEIDRRQLRTIRELGSGNFGKVFYGLYRGTQEVAIKTLKPGSMSPQAFLDEAAIMRRYRHEKLVPLYGVCSIGLPLLIITEYMCKGALLNYLRDNPESASLTIMDLIDMASQVASGMAYLERVKLVHRDLAARNCLVGEKRVVKVADFGLARIIEEDYYIAQVGAKFPIKWTAPEAASRGKFTNKSDVWSFGVLLYEIVTKGGAPYPGMSNREVIEHVERGFRMPKPKNVECPNSIYQIMLNCWDKDPDKRPTFEYLYSYFDDFFVSTEPRYRDAEDYQANGGAGGGENLYDKMVK